jgi:hypothetical protein
LRTREHAAVETALDGATRLAVFDRIVDRGERHDLALEQPELRAALAAALEQAASEFTARSP